MTQCCALNCRNMGIHVFPKDPQQRKKWEEAVRSNGRKNFQSSRWSRLCPMHFKKEDYYGQSIYTTYKPLHHVLRKTAVPCLFKNTKSPKDPLALKHSYKVNKRTRKKPLCNQNVEPQTSTFGIVEKPLYNLIPMSSEEEEEDINKIYDLNNTANCIDILLPKNISKVYSSRSTQVDLQFLYYGHVKRFIMDDAAIKFYTGFDTYKKFHLIFLTLPAHKIEYYGSEAVNLSTEDQFFLILMKLRQNKCNFELSRFFNVSISIVNYIFITWMNFIYYHWWTVWKIWPSMENVCYYMPDQYKVYIPKTKNTPQGDNNQIFNSTQIEANEKNKQKKYNLAKTYKILTSELDINYIPIANKIFLVCYMCYNFPNIVVKK